MSLLKARQRVAEVMADGAGSPVYHCLQCRSPTPHKDLCTYGARCHGCFKAFCAAPQPTAKPPTQMRKRELYPGDPS